MNKIQIVSYFLQGNSFPVVLKRNDDTFFVKLREGMSGEFSLLSEWFGNTLGSLIGLNTRTPIWITIPENVEFNDIYIEVRELVAKSVGLNIGYKYIEEIKEVSIPELINFDEDALTDIFLFDILMMNIDRTITNLNLLNISGKPTTSDFDSSLLFNEIINGRDLLADNRILQCFKANPLYQIVDSGRIDQFIEKVNRIPIHTIVNSIPNGILNDTRRNTLLDGLQQRAKNRWRIEETLERLECITLETEEERNSRINKNREKLEKLVNATTKG